MALAPAAVTKLQPSPRLSSSNAPAQGKNHANGQPSQTGSHDTLVLKLSEAELAARTLYVGNLPFRVRWQDLKDLFRKVGMVARADVALWPDNRSKGHGNVVFANPSDVQVAKEMFQSFSWMNRTLEVRTDHPFPDHLASQHAAQAHSGALFLPMQRSLSDQGMPYHVNGAMPGLPAYGTAMQKEDSARSTTRRTVNGDYPAPEFVPQYAHMANDVGSGNMGEESPDFGQGQGYAMANGMINVPMMPMHMQYTTQMGMMALPIGMPMGMVPYGMVPYMPHSMQMPAQNSSNGIQRYANFPGRVLFVGNLPYQMQWQDLKDLFRQAGRILRADVAIDAVGRSRGFGTVVYGKAEDAQRALQMFNGKDFNGRILKVHFDKFSEQTSPTLSSTGLPNTTADRDVDASETKGLSLDTPSFVPEYRPGEAQAQRGVELFRDRQRDASPSGQEDSPRPNESSPSRPLFSENDRSAGSGEGHGRYASNTNGLIDAFTTPLATPSQTVSRSSHLPGPIHIPPTNFASHFNFAQMYSSHGRSMSNTGSLSPAAGPGSLMTPSTLTTSGRPDRYGLGGPFSFQIPPPTPPFIPHHLLSPGAGPYESGMEHGYHGLSSAVNLAPGAPVYTGGERQGIKGVKSGGLDSVAEEDHSRTDSGADDDVYHASDYGMDRSSNDRSSDHRNVMAHLMMDNHASPLFPVPPPSGSFGYRHEAGEKDEPHTAASPDYFFDSAIPLHHHDLSVDDLADQYKGLGLAPSSMPAHTAPPASQSLQAISGGGPGRTDHSPDIGNSLRLPDQETGEYSMPSRGSIDSARPSAASFLKTESEGRRKSFVDIV